MSSKLVYPVFKECSGYTLDPFWIEVLENCSVGKFPKGFKVNPKDPATLMYIASRPTGYSEGVQTSGTVKKNIHTPNRTLQKSLNSSEYGVHSRKESVGHFRREWTSVKLIDFTTIDTYSPKDYTDIYVAIMTILRDDPHGLCMRSPRDTFNTPKERSFGTPRTKTKKRTKVSTNILICDYVQKMSSKWNLSRKDRIQLLNTIKLIFLLKSTIRNQSTESGGLEIEYDNTGSIDNIKALRIVHDRKGLVVGFFIDTSPKDCSSKSGGLSINDSKLKSKKHSPADWGKQLEQYVKVHRESINSHEGTLRKSSVSQSFGLQKE